MSKGGGRSKAGGLQGPKRTRVQHGEEALGEEKVTFPNIRRKRQDHRRPSWTGAETELERDKDFLRVQLPSHLGN